MITREFLFRASEVERDLFQREKGGLISASLECFSLLLRPIGHDLRDRRLRGYRRHHSHVHLRSRDLRHLSGQRHLDGYLQATSDSWKSAGRLLHQGG
jgi:hypothetical protein